MPLICIDIVVNSRKTSTIKNPESRLYLELDIWIPDLKLGFEFQVTSN